MSAHVLLNLFNKLRKRIRCKVLSGILLFFHSKFNEFNNECNARSCMNAKFYMI